MANGSTSVKENKKIAAAPQEKSTFRHWNLICIGILLAVTAIVFSQFVFTDKMLVSSDQLVNVGSKQYLSNSISSHSQFPTWESTRLSGMPSIDALFSDALYPPSTIVRALTPAYHAYGYLMVLHVFLAGLFFFFMLHRSFKVPRLAAFTGAMFYMLSPQFVSHVNPGHDGKMFIIALLPFVVWRLRSLLALPTLRNAALMGLGVAAMVLTSHIQMTYFALWGIFLYWVADMVLAIRSKEGNKRILLKASFFWTAVFIGLGISFVQLYPSFMFVREAFSVRGIDRGFDHATSWSLHWAEVFSLWVHEFGNALQYYWGKNYFKLDTDYSGMIPLLLSVLAIASKPKSIWRVFWGAVAVFAVLFSLGANTPFFTLIYHTVPGVKSFRAPGMIMFWFSFATVLLSVYFIKDLLSGRFNLDGKAKQKWTRGLWIGMGGVTLLAVLFSIESFTAGFARSMVGTGDAHRVFQANFNDKFVPALWLWWLFITVSLGMFLAVINDKLKPAVLVFTLLGIGMVDTIKVNSQFIEVDSPRKYYYHNDPVLGELKSEFDKAPFRVFSVSRTFATQNQEGAYGLEGVSGFHDNELVNYRAFRGDQGDSHFMESITDVSPDGRSLSLSMAKIIRNTPFLDLADVGYILLRSSSGGVAKVKNPTSLGRLSYAADYKVMEEDNIIPALRRGVYNYRTTVALIEEPKLPFTQGKASPVVDTDDNDGDNLNNDDGDVLTDQQLGADGERLSAIDHSRSSAIVNNKNQQLKVDWKKYTPNKRIASVTMPADGFLRISEVYYPGWRISIDGAPVKYYRSDMAWMAVPLKTGSYEVLMEPKSLYMDDAIKVTVVFTLITLIILCLPLLRRNRGRAVKA